MSWDQLGLDLFLLEGPDLQEAELVKSLVSQQLASDRGGAVLSALIDFYLESSSIQAVALLSTVREQLHKTLLEKLNDCLNKAATRLAALMLLGHMIRKQPPWVHLVTRCPLLASLLRCLKTDSDVVVLTTGVLLLVTLLPMIPQCSKQHVYDFFDVFGRLASWTLRNPGKTGGSRPHEDLLCFIVCFSSGAGAAAAPPPGGALLSVPQTLWHVPGKLPVVSASSLQHEGEQGQLPPRR